MQVNKIVIDRPMVNLFFEIKRSMPFESRKNMKIASPDVADRLIDIYDASNNPSLRLLIEQFMAKAGQEWSQRLSENPYRAH